MKNRISILPLIFPIVLLSQNVLRADNSGAAIHARVTVSPGKAVSRVDDRFWGTNFLFWIEDDASLADGRIGTLLREIPCGVLRYPGGTVADNFHWQTNLLDNNAMFPYEDGRAKSDFDEFMIFCRRVGAEPILVVNTQSWFLKGDVEGGAADAARWVRYCKEKDYQVKYWEIGNETYWHPVMTATEYGRLVKVYAREMKKADPGILVSANGHWDIGFSGVKDRIDPSLWDEFREMYLAVETPADYKALNDYRDKTVRMPANSGVEKWWENVIRECADDMDMVSVHWYFQDNTIKHLDRKIIELKRFLKEKTGKDYPVCLTEYNCNESDRILRVAGLAEGIGRFLNAGIDISCFWPMRIGGLGHRSMLGMEDKEPQYPYQIFSLFAKSLKGTMIDCQSGEDLYAFACDNPQEMVVVVSGRKIAKRTTVRLDTGMKSAHAPITATVHRAEAKNTAKLENDNLEFEVDPQGMIIFAVNPAEFAIIRIAKQL